MSSGQHHQQWKLEDFSQKYKTFFAKAKDMQEIQKLNFHTMDSQTFTDVLFHTLHPLESKGYTKIISPVQKAMTITIYQNGGRASDDQIISFLTEHWKDITNCSKAQFVREPDIRLLRANEKIQKNDAYMFLRDPHDSKYLMVNDVTNGPMPKPTEFKSSSRDNEEKNRNRSKSNDDAKNKLMKYSYTSGLYQKEDKFEANFKMPAMELDKKSKDSKKSNKSSQSHSPQISSVINHAFITTLDSTQINVSMTASEQLLCYTLPQVKIDYHVDINNIEIPNSLTFDEKVLHIVEMCTKRNQSDNSLYNGVTAQAIADKLRPYVNDPGKFKNLPIHIRVRAILLEAKQIDLVDDGYSGRQELWFWKHPDPLKPTFPCSSMENKYRIILPKPFQSLKPKDFTIGQLYEKVQKDKFFATKSTEFLP